MFDCCAGDDMNNGDLDAQLGSQNIKGENLKMKKDLPIPSSVDTLIKSSMLSMGKQEQFSALSEMIKFKFEGWNLDKERVKLLDQDISGMGKVSSIRQMVHSAVEKDADAKGYHKNKIVHYELEEGFYLGQVKKGEPYVMEGVGILLDAEGDLYLSLFERSLPHFFGSCLYSNGDYYYGSFLNGQKIHGTVYFKSKQKMYTGSFEDGLPHGNGIMTFDDGRSYKGGIQRGMLEGKGEFHWPNKNWYKGDFVGGKQHGNAILFIKEKERSYETYWKNGVLQE